MKELIHMVDTYLLEFDCCLATINAYRVLFISNRDSDSSIKHINCNPHILAKTDMSETTILY